MSNPSTNVKFESHTAYDNAQPAPYKELVGRLEKVFLEELGKLNKDDVHNFCLETRLKDGMSIDDVPNNPREYACLIALSTAVNHALGNVSLERLKTISINSAEASRHMMELLHDSACDTSQHVGAIQWEKDNPEELARLIQEAKGQANPSFTEGSVH